MVLLMTLRRASTLAPRVAWKPKAASGTLKKAEPNGPVSGAPASSSSVRKPRSASRAASAQPAEPAPTTMTSNGPAALWEVGRRRRRSTRRA